MPERRTPNILEPLIEALEAAEFIDGPAKALNKKVDEVLWGTGFKDLISGTPIGHALHPMLTDVVIGSFLSATALDVIGGDDNGQAAERLITLGIASYPPTALTGTSDWTDGGHKNDSNRRIGIAHAATNAAALSLYGASLAARRRGRRKSGVALGLVGAGALGVAAYLGGHLTLVNGIGVDQTAFSVGPAQWTEVARVDDLADGEPKRVIAGETPVMLLREGRSTYAIHDRCSHRGCSLADGEVSGRVVECPCHASRFSVEDGSLLNGPATQPQPALEARVRKGVVEVRARS